VPRKRWIVLALAACAFSSGAAEAARVIAPHSLLRIATIDDRFQSYNVEMAEIIGGNFWKPYGLGGTLRNPAGALGSGIVGQDPNLFQKMPPLDTASPRLRKLAAALGPAYVRVSGTWANSVYFHDADTPPPAKAPPGFNGVLSRAQWKGAIDFARAANAEIVSSVTISDGVRDRAGLWTPGEAAKWLAYTRAIGGHIAAAEFFNEPTMPTYGGSPKNYDAAAYARDFAIFRPFVKRAAPGMAIVGPGGVGEGLLIPTGGMPGMIRTEDLLAATPRPDFDIFSYHHYPAASMRCASMGAQTQTSAAQALSEQWLSRADISQTLYGGLRDHYQPGKPIWITEIADAACGGNPWAATFLDSFRYADTLGRLAKHGVKIMFHNTLASSEYGLLAPGTFEPRPNYWTALLWRRLMGSAVLDAGPSREGLHLYAHCLRAAPGGVALLAINNSRTAPSSIDLAQASERYTLSADALQATSVRLNGTALELASGDDLPILAGQPQAAGTVRFAPATITFLALPEASNAQCTARE
jgi:heparanase